MVIVLFFPAFQVLILALIRVLILGQIFAQIQALIGVLILGQIFAQIQALVLILGQTRAEI